MEYARIEGTSDQLATMPSRAGVEVVAGRLNPDGSRCIFAYLDDGERAALAAQGMTVTLLKDQQRVAEEFAATRAQVGAGPTPPTPRFKGEFSAELIQAALVFAREKANDFARRWGPRRRLQGSWIWRLRACLTSTPNSMQ
jgi:hypothetical protein